MHYKTNRQNHDFQLAYFVAGSCKTPDAAWSLLCDLRDDRQDALNLAKADSLRTEAKRMRAQAIVDRDGVTEADKLEAQAELLEINGSAQTTQKNIAAAEAELAMIHKLQERLQPLRKYAHLPDAEAHEAAQAEEWKLELMYRAENFMLMQGSIPVDQFDTMRMHPAFTTEILPFLNEIRAQLVNVQGDLTKLKFLTPALDIPKLLGHA
jgi:hypothetical protein